MFRFVFGAVRGAHNLVLFGCICCRFETGTPFQFLGFVLLCCFLSMAPCRNAKRETLHGVLSLVGCEPLIICPVCCCSCCLMWGSNSISASGACLACCFASEAFLILISRTRKTSALVFALCLSGLPEMLTDNLVRSWLLLIAFEACETRFTFWGFCCF